MNIFKSANHLYTQIINDMEGRTIVSASTLDKEIRKQGKKNPNKETAKIIGKQLAERALAKGIKRVVFDRGGYRYHGQIKALAEAAREGGLEF